MMPPMASKNIQKKNKVKHNICILHLSAQITIVPKLELSGFGRRFPDIPLLNYPSKDDLSSLIPGHCQGDVMSWSLRTATFLALMGTTACNKMHLVKSGA